MSPKAGLFAGEVTPQAPADDSPTSKQKGYVWMEYGLGGGGGAPLTDCNEIWEIGTIVPDLHVGGVVDGVWDGELITGIGLLADGRTDNINTTNDAGNYTRYKGFNPGVEDGVAEVFYPECQWYNYSGPFLDNQIAGSTIDFAAWGIDFGTGTRTLDHDGIDGTANNGGVATDTSVSDTFAIRHTSALNSIPSNTNPMTAVIVIAKEESAPHYTFLQLLNNTTPFEGVSVIFNAETGSIVEHSAASLGSNRAFEVRDNVDWWEVYMQTDANGSSSNEGVILLRPAYNLDGGQSGDNAATGRTVMGDHKIFAERSIGMVRGGALEPKLGLASPSSVIEISSVRVDSANHDDSQGGYYFEWRPLYDHAEISRDVEILSLNDSTGLLFYDWDNELLTATDGTNTATVPLTIERETKYRLGVIWGDFLRVGADGVWGTAVAYDGAFPGGSDFTICRNPEAVNYCREQRGYQRTYTAAFNEIDILMAG